MNMLRDVTPCISVDMYRRFTRTCYIYYHSVSS